jgi:estrone sulfotransferase
MRSRYYPSGSSPSSAGIGETKGQMSGIYLSQTNTSARTSGTPLDLLSSLAGITFIVSYPKSGNTWIRFLLANMLAPGKTISFRNIDELIPALDGPPELLTTAEPPHFIKTHRKNFLDKVERFIYIYRDGRDALVSRYHYRTSRGQFSGTFCEFLADERNIPFNPWHEHVSQAFKEISQRPESETLVLQYERMLEDPYEAASRLAKFCHLDLDHQQLLQAVENCRFEKLQEIERIHGPEKLWANNKFFRKGTAGQWKEMFSPQDLRNFNAVAGETLLRLGYALD